nr:MAG TPA: hypothetical protein [Caudoviricetes sp.]
MQIKKAGLLRTFSFILFSARAIRQHLSVG